MKKLLFVFALLFTLNLFADTVTLTNGDRLTGVIQKFDDQKLYLKPDYSDAIAIKWSSIAKVTGDQPLHLERSDDTHLTATTITTSGDQLTLEGASPTTLSAHDVKNIRSDSEQVSYEKSLHPGWGHAWTGGGNFGVALSKGNSDTTNVSLGFAAERKTVHDKTTIYANDVYASDGHLSLTTANDIRAGLRYDRDIAKRLFGYGSGDFEHDALADLTLRSVLGAGLGVHFINTKTTSLDLLAGGAYTRENYGTGLNNNFVSLSLGETFTRQLSASTSFNEKAFVLPYLNSVGDYRASFDAGFATKISKLLTWQVSLSDRYVTNPLPTFKKNDLLLTTGLGVTFGKKE